MKKFIVTAVYVKTFQIEATSEPNAYDVGSRKLEEVPLPTGFQFSNWHMQEVK